MTINKENLLFTHHALTVIIYCRICIMTGGYKCQNFMKTGNMCNIESYISCYQYPVTSVLLVHLI